MSRLISRVNVNIAINTALSSFVGLGELTPHVLVMPAAWTDACITFMESIDNTNYFSVMKDDGSELMIAAYGGARIILPSGLSYAKQLIIRSGTSYNPVNQAAARDLYVELWE